MQFLVVLYYLGSYKGIPNGNGNGACGLIICLRGTPAHAAQTCCLGLAACALEFRCRCLDHLRVYRAQGLGFRGLGVEGL